MVVWYVLTKFITSRGRLLTAHAAKPTAHDVPTIIRHPPSTPRHAVTPHTTHHRYMANSSRPFASELPSPLGGGTFSSGSVAGSSPGLSMASGQVSMHERSERILRTIHQGGRPAWVAQCPPALRRIVDGMVHQEPHMRPDLESVVRGLQTNPELVAWAAW